MFGWIHWDPSSEFLIVPFFQIPITWYGVLFATGFWLSFHIFTRMVQIAFKEKKKEDVTAFAEKLLLYVILGTVIGARLGHIFFYEHPMAYLTHPLSIFKTWEGGLASHGAVLAIVFAVYLFSQRVKTEWSELPFLKLLDYIAVPGMFIGFMIRVGNFFNQEILGVSTDKPWGVVFGHPADGSSVLPRHPAQLYEAFFYLGLFAFLAFLWYRKRDHLVPGRIAGVMLLSTFLFRFFIEFIKTEQSVWLDHTLLMGQFLSIPIIAIGTYLLIRKESFRRAID